MGRKTELTKLKRSNKEEWRRQVLELRRSEELKGTQDGKASSYLESIVVKNSCFIRGRSILTSMDDWLNEEKKKVDYNEEKAKADYIKLRDSGTVARITHLGKDCIALPAPAEVINDRGQEWQRQLEQPRRLGHPLNPWQQTDTQPSFTDNSLRIP